MVESGLSVLAKATAEDTGDRAVRTGVLASPQSGLGFRHCADISCPTKTGSTGPLLSILFKFTPSPRLHALCTINASRAEVVSLFSLCRMSDALEPSSLIGTAAERCDRVRARRVTGQCHGLRARRLVLRARDLSLVRLKISLPTQLRQDNQSIPLDVLATSCSPYFTNALFFLASSPVGDFFPCCRHRIVGRQLDGLISSALQWCPLWLSESAVAEISS